MFIFCAPKMELAAALLVYLAVLIMVSFFLLYIGYTIFSSFVLAIIVSFVVLNIVFPVTSSKLDEVSALTSLYIFVHIFTFTVFFLYAFITTVSDTRNKKKFPMRYNNV